MSDVVLLVGQNMLSTSRNAPTLKTVVYHHLTHSHQYFLYPLNLLQNPPIQILNHTAFSQNDHTVFLAFCHWPLSHDVHLRPLRQTQVHLSLKNAYHARYHASSLLHHPLK
jgi:hypothetical protein